MDFLWRRKMDLLPGSLVDFIRTEVQLTSNSKEVVGFVVLQLYEVGGIRHEVVKHDCAHGKYHVHRYYEGSTSKVIHSDEPISAELYWQAKKDVLENWRAYRERYVRKYSIK